MSEVPLYNQVLRRTSHVPAMSEAIANEHLTLHMMRWTGLAYRVRSRGRTVLRMLSASAIL